MKVQMKRTNPLIDLERISEIGGLENPDIRRILCAFIEDLPGYLALIERLRNERDTVEMLAVLHKLSGSSRTCGFTGISRAIESWKTLADPNRVNLHTNLKLTVAASIEEWNALTK